LRGWTSVALEVLKQDDQIDQEFDGLLRKLITYMMEDPRTISASIDLVFVAKAIERVGDHAKNIAEPSSTSSRARTCATLPMRSNRPCCDGSARSP
jgi:phosphate transport system protein